MERIRTEDPARYARYLDDRAKFEEGLNKNGVSFQKSSSTYIIPIVFHIIHNGNAGKIKEAKIYDAIRILNEDFNALSPDTGKVDPIFWPLYADISVEFRLAKLDPSGNCSDGINYYNHESHSTGGNDATYGWVQDQWTPSWKYDKYLNIYTNRNLNGYYGWTYGATKDEFSGVMVVANSVGTTNNYDNRTLTHEIGHWFNLKHTWGNGKDAGLRNNCNSDDKVTDTPNCKGTYGCHNTQNSCDDGAGDLPDNTQNYMDYGCGIMFTEGQKTRIHGSLNGSVHDNLWSASNLIASGVEDPYDFGLVSCGFDEVDIIVDDSQIICTDGSISFTYETIGATADSAEWSFPGGTPSSSSESNPIITYSTPSEYVAYLDVYSGQFSASDSINITVIELGTGVTHPYATSFQDSAAFANDFIVSNLDNDDYAWERITTNGYDDNFSVRFFNNASLVRTQDELWGPLIDLSEITNTAYITFRVAYSYLKEENDKLEVFFTKTCGETWNRFYVSKGSDLKTMETGAPSTYEDWREETIELPSGYNVSGVQYKFRFTSSGGNHIWIDDINNTVTGIEKSVAIDRTLTIYPNPITSTSVISFKLVNPEEDVNIEVYNILGKKISNRSYGKFSKGKHQLNLSKELVSPDSQKSGIYIIKIRFGKEVVTRKVLVK
ncbi:MAG: T9SS type A sorting domain-containing protein [Flavobacteriales bacterium]|nr:T9SS type A sorting domain-containing protein [Flavobacteriales bacterium]